MKTYSILSIILFIKIAFACQAQQTMKMVNKNEMKVQWYHQNNRVFFEMSAPTKGWVTIGFNDQNKLKNAYLIMGRLVTPQANAEVVEHFTSAPGNYRSIESLGKVPAIQHVYGEQKNGRTILKFSLPVIPKSKYQQALSPGRNCVLILAYSTHTDFQHHSIMRTSLNITL